jgi:serine/threonine protein kinase
VPPGQQFTYTVRAQGRLTDEKQFGDVVVRANVDGSIVRMRDVARIEMGAQTYSMIGRLNGSPAAILAIYQLPGSNALDTMHRHHLQAIGRRYSDVGVENGRIVELAFFGQGEQFIVMEWLEGESLGARLSKGSLDPHDALVLAHRLAQGLAHAHTRGVVHRDVKPSNVLLVDGDPRRAVLLDFGIAHVPETATFTRTGAVIGTVGYMAPEQVRGEPADHRSDIFALGCVLYEMLTGERAYKRETAAETMAAILNQSHCTPWKRAIMPVRAPFSTTSASMMTSDDAIPKAVSVSAAMIVPTSVSPDSHRKPSAPVIRKADCQP